MQSARKLESGRKSIEFYPRRRWHSRACDNLSCNSNNPMKPESRIEPPDLSLAPAIQAKLDGKTKPLGSLGRLESIALRIALIQGSLKPQLCNPHILVCAGDHGALADVRGQSLSAFPQAVTWQMVENFLAGGAAINVLAREAGLRLTVADAGVAYAFGRRENLVDAKIAPGTASWFDGPAMQHDQCMRAMANGSALIAKLARDGCNIVGFGEMGIGNSASAALLTHMFTDAAIDVCVGRGTGLDDDGLAHKCAILARLAQSYAGERDALSLLAHFGGFEIAMLTGAMLAAARARMVLLIDGFIVTAALLAAHAIEPTLLEYCIFSHCSQERGHAIQLRHLDAVPLLDLDLRLGEGTGAALAYPLVRSAVATLNEMASFEQAKVSNRERP